MDLSNKHKLYRIYRIRKPNGKYRVIHAPCEELKTLQKECADVVATHYHTPDCVFGFVAGRSAADAAKLHTGKDWVISLDIKDFFPSISKEMLMSYGIPEEVADIATLDNVLVQGSPCSPVLSNYYMRIVDITLQIWAYNQGISYSRYADDIVLSGMDKPKYEYVNHVEKVLKKHGLRLNKKKTKFMYKNQEQNVLGITVNSGVSINHKTRKSFKNKMKYEGVTDREVGYLSYINSVNKQQYNRLKSLQ